MIYKPLTINEKNHEITYETPLTTDSSSILSNAKSKILVSKHYNKGNLFILKNTNALVCLMDNKWFMHQIKNKNTVYLIDEPCNEQAFQKIKKLFKKTWHEHGILHHIVLLTKCEVCRSIFY